MTALIGLAWIWVVLGLMMWIELVINYKSVPCSLAGRVLILALYFPVCVCFGVFFWLMMLWHFVKRAGWRE